MLSAPTGSGKTVVFELAIIRLLASINPDVAVRSKIVYSKFILVCIQKGLK